MKTPLINQTKDEFFMREALKEAQKAFNEGEVPIGAILVLNGNIIARAHNLVESKKKASAHAEMIVLEEAASKLENWRLQETILYTTLEPCSMCGGALFLYRVKEVVYGAKDLRHGAHGSFIDLFEKKHPIHPVAIRGGILASESQELLQKFFRLRRDEKRRVS